MTSIQDALLGEVSFGTVRKGFSLIINMTATALD